MPKIMSVLQDFTLDKASNENTDELTSFLLLTLFSLQPETDSEQQSSDIREIRKKKSNIAFKLFGCQVFALSSHSCVEFFNEKFSIFNHENFFTRVKFCTVLVVTPVSCCCVVIANSTKKIKLQLTQFPPITTTLAMTPTSTKHKRPGKTNNENWINSWKKWDSRCCCWDSFFFLLYVLHLVQERHHRAEERHGRDYGTFFSPEHTKNKKVWAD